MQVKTLIRDTIWLPATGYSATSKPEVSVLLPTFRQGGSGLFRRSVESILGQTLTNLELIIIDDASVDGTAEQIAEFQHRDPRVSCLRHVNNIGLPAVSEYEAYMRARAERIAFAFDDTVFNADALRQLLLESVKVPSSLVYGHVELPMMDPIGGGVHTIRLGAPHSASVLATSNFFANCAVLLPRHILEDVGLFDPHIVVARVCDWDLWRRIARRYELRFVDVAVGREEGAASDTSLGNTSCLDHWAAEEWMGTRRNGLLRPTNFPGYEVLRYDDSHGLSSRTVCETLALRHAFPRQWAIPSLTQTDNDVDEGGYTLIVALSYDASVSLCFEFLPFHMAKRVRVVIYTAGGGLEALARATCVIFVRGISSFRVWLDAAVALEIPRYYFLDDNLPLLVEHNEFAVEGEDFTLPVFRHSLTVFDGVLLTSENLLAYFGEQGLHQNLIHFPVACVDQNPLFVAERGRPRDREVTVAFTGGTHRVTGLWEVIIPALEQLCASTYGVHFIMPETAVPEHLAKLARLPVNMRITMLAFEPGYLIAMRRFARYSPDFIAQAPSRTRNNPYKTLHPLLAARLIDAVAVLPTTAPYDAIADSGCAVVVQDSFNVSAWHETFYALTRGDYDLDQIKGRNATFCSSKFSGAVNVRVLSELHRRYGGEPDWPEQVKRLARLDAYRRDLGLDSSPV